LAGEPMFQPAEGVEQLRRRGHRRFPGRRRRVAVARALEQAHPESLFELAQPAKGGRVIDAEAPRGAGERAARADRLHQTRVLPPDCSLRSLQAPVAILPYLLAVPKSEQWRPLNHGARPMTDLRLAPYAAFLLRLALGAMFLAHSVLLKLFVFTLPGTAAFFT